MLLDPLSAYADDWLGNRAFIGHAVGRYSHVNDFLVAQEERARPGFTKCLRDVALEALSASDPATRIRPLRVLAFIGPVEDLPRPTPPATMPARTVARHAPAALWDAQWRKDRSRWPCPPRLMLILSR